MIVKAPAALLLALLLLGTAPIAFSQPACMSDGFAVVFDEKNGSMELDQVRVKEITNDSNRNIRMIGLGNAGIQPARASRGELRVDGLGNVFPDHGIPGATINRREKNAWEVEFEKGDYEFLDEGDLKLEIQVSVTGGQAVHRGGGASAVTLSAIESDVDVRWHGGGRLYLKEISGALDFSLTDLMQMGLFGTYRAEVSICINIRGNV